MEIYEKYLNPSGKICLEHVNGVMKIIKGKTDLLQKCLFLRILTVTDRNVFEQLELNGLRDIIHEWFTAGVNAKDAYFLILMVESLSYLPELRDMSDLVKSLSNLNNSDLTKKARELLMKWKDAAELLEKKNKFTFINLDKSSTVKRINGSLRSSGYDQEDDDESPTENSVTAKKDIKVSTSKTHPKTIKVNDPLPTEIKESNNSNKKSLLADEIKLDEDPETNLVLANKIKKTKKVSWAPNEQLKTFIVIDNEEEDETMDTTPPMASSPTTLPNSLPADVVSVTHSDVTSPTYDATKPYFPQDINTPATETVRSVLSQTLFDVIIASKKEGDLCKLTTMEVYKILKKDENKLGQSGIFLIPPQ